MCGAENTTETNVLMATIGSLVKGMTAHVTMLRPEVSMPTACDPKGGEVKHHLLGPEGMACRPLQWMWGTSTQRERMFILAA